MTNPQPKTEPERFDRFAVKAEVERQGLTLTGIAEAAGLYPSACRQGLAGQSRTGAEAIAKALGKPFETLFPNYGVRHNSANNSSAKRRSGESQKTTNVADEVLRAG